MNARQGYGMANREMPAITKKPQKQPDLPKICPFVDKKFQRYLHF
jgi:hypothetical protein